VATNHGDGGSNPSSPTTSPRGSFWGCKTRYSPSQHQIYYIYTKILTHAVTLFIINDF
jgi:hypothetical protein